MKRQFKTGANRNSSNGKLDFARFLDPKVIESYAKYLLKHSHLEDGTLRDPDNWKKGMPTQTYMDGLWRHMMDVWMIHEYGESIRPENGENVGVDEALNGVIFNAMGFMFNVINKK